MKQYIVDRHTTPSTPALDEVPNEKIRVFKNEATIDAALSSLDENEIVATEDGAESSARIGNPLGTILAIHSNAVPYGYLPCNGVAFDEHQYPALYALLGDNHTPDLRECNLVGAGQSERTILDDAGHAHDVYTIGQFKDDQIQNITGNIGSVLAEGSKSGPFDVTATGINCSGLSYGQLTGYGQQARFDASRVARAGTTTHGKNFGINYVIKATSGLEETQQDYVLQSLLEADSYSTDEVATGKKWIDGKMIYRRIFYSATNWANGTIIGTISNLGMVIKIRDVTCATNNLYYENLGKVGSDSQKTNVRATDGAVMVDRTGIFANSKPSTVIIEYTKN